LFTNLIGNGLKYTRSDTPTVVVGARTDDPDWATYFVTDNGIGIDPQFHTKIFQIFRRLHAREEYEGTGAGLAICQKIVQAHGGSIWVESTPGQGSTFFFTLPRSRVPPAAARILETSAVSHG
jgi:light-regulated signal transduction histidine kinase (bacteriophytochrome)